MSDALSTLVESAIQYANTTIAAMNTTVAESFGTDVLWFRLLPDKRNQDVIFQTYTLFGVEDCPLRFKAMYSDSGYDDAAITYNIMGLEYQVPMTMEIAVSTWYKATNNDGTLPQRGDIVFVPLSNKLLQVVSMSPIKKVAAQTTGFKVNLSIYTPTRNRIVGENLLTTIDENTTNIDKKFGQDIENELKDIVDAPQSSMFTSTELDKYKKVTKSSDEDSIITYTNNIHHRDLIVDGHVVARSYYDMNIDAAEVVTYSRIDNITKSDCRSLSMWIKMCGESKYKNVKINGVDELEDGSAILTLGGQIVAKTGDEVMIEHGNVVMYGKIESTGPYKMHISKDMYKNVKDISPIWYNLPGYTVRRVSRINMLSSNCYTIDLVCGRYVEFYNGKKTLSIQLPKQIDSGNWYGFIVNYGPTISISVFTEGKLSKHTEILNVKNRLAGEYGVTRYYLKSSDSEITNIRLYSIGNQELDKQITDILTYNIKNNSRAIINDSADIPLNKPYYGEQR